MSSIYFKEYMDDEDKQYDDELAEKEDELGAHGFHADGEDEEGDEPVADPEFEEEESF